MSINDFIYEDQFDSIKKQDKHTNNKIQNIREEEMEILKEPMKEIKKNSSKVIIDAKYIIKEQPRTFIVRKFMRKNLESIKSEEQELFEEEESN